MFIAPTEFKESALFYMEITLNIKEKSFEEVFQMYEPAIKKQLVSLRIYKDFEEFYQLGRIALWQAYERFELEKGNFSTYAITMIRGTMLSRLTKETTYQERYASTSDEALSYIPNLSEEDPLELEILETYLTPLTDRERTWVYEAMLMQKKISEIATDYNVSTNTVKSWRKSAIHKLRKHLCT